MEHNRPQRFSIAARIRSFGYAFKGFAHFFVSQHNGWIHTLAAVVAIAAGFWLGLSTIEWCIVAITIAAVFAAEMLNTAVEFIVDLVSPEYNELAGKAKDVGAAAVLIVSMAALVVAALIYGPKLMALFS